MGRKLLRYRAQIDALLRADRADVDWPAVHDRHVRQIGFFQHERLVHLLVTLAFGGFTLLAALAVLAARPGDALLEWPGLALCALFVAILAAYIRHYFLLENNVQALYDQADALERRFSLVPPEADA